jgi:beta-glucosidase
VFVGYRHYDRHGIRPQVPFGHGLSYTTFAYAGLRLEADRIAPGGRLEVALEVTNTGARVGSEVVQIYVRDQQAPVPRPEKELKAFAKVALAPGETATVRRELDMRALAWFDMGAGAWRADAGRFEVLVGASAADIRARAAFELTGDWREPVAAQGELR